MNWATPQRLFDKLDKEFGFQLDVCATRSNRKCKRYYGPTTDGLKREWEAAVCWMNPPYGREISAWMKKAYEQSLRGRTIVALVPSRTNAPWWHEYVMKASEIRFIRKKVPFVGPKKGVPFFGSCIVVFEAYGSNKPPSVRSWDQVGGP